MARPPKAAEEKRIVLIRVRLTLTEKIALQKAADQLGLTLSDFCRVKTIASTPRIKKATPERAAFIRGLAELGKIGSNVNQIARSLNRRDESLYGENIANAIYGVNTLTRHLSELLNHGH